MRYEKRGSNAKTPIFFNHRKTQKNIDKPLFFSLFLYFFIRCEINSQTQEQCCKNNTFLSGPMQLRHILSYPYQRELTYWREPKPGLGIQMLHGENPYERNFGTNFHWNKKIVSIHNIYKTQFFLFVNSITTQQFNTHRTVQ